MAATMITFRGYVFATANPKGFYRRRNHNDPTRLRLRKQEGRVNGKLPRYSVD